MPKVDCIVDVIKIKCPYCEHINKILPKNSWELKIHYCDIEDGGCDLPFIVKIQVSTVVKCQVGEIKFKGKENE